MNTFIKVAILLLIASCTKPEIMGTVEFSFVLSPDENLNREQTEFCRSRIPDTAYVHMTSPEKEELFYKIPVKKLSGGYRTTEDIREPIGDYTINRMELYREGEIIYQVMDNTDYSDFTVATVPMDLFLRERHHRIGSDIFCVISTD